MQRMDERALCKDSGGDTISGMASRLCFRGECDENYKVNIFTATTADMDAMDKWINDYCRAHPLRYSAEKPRKDCQ